MKEKEKTTETHFIPMTVIDMVDVCTGLSDDEMEIEIRRSWDLDSEERRHCFESFAAFRQHVLNCIAAGDEEE